MRNEYTVVNMNLPLRTGSLQVSRTFFHAGVGNQLIIPPLQNISNAKAVEIIAWRTES
jgi:hypothetical protein